MVSPMSSHAAHPGRARGTRTPGPGWTSQNRGALDESHWIVPRKGAPAIPCGLWTKLVISYAGIILICLALAGSAFVYLLQPYQTEQALNRMSELSIPLGVQVRFLETQGATAAQIAEFLDEQARHLDVRILLIGDDGSI